MKPKPETKIRSQREIDAFWNCVFFGALLMFILLVLALSCVGASAESRTIFIRGGDEDAVVQELGDEFVVAGESMNYAARLTKSATLTVSEHNGLETWQENNLLFYAYHDPIDGSWTLKSIAERNAVTPTLSGNRVTFPTIYTVPGGTVDLEYTFTTNRVLKTYRFSGVAGAILPSPTSADFFPGVDSANLYFAIGANPMVYEASAGVIAEMDDVSIDLADDQVIGDKFVVKAGGGFLHEFLPPYAGMNKGQHLYLGDLQCYFAVWQWEKVKNEAEFDPSYSFQVEGLLEDTQIAEDYPTINYYTSAVMNTIGSISPHMRCPIFQISSATLASTYNLAGITDTINSEITSLSLKLTAFKAAGDPTYNTVRVKREMKAANLSTVTWNTRNTALQTLYDNTVSSWVDGTTHTFDDASLLEWVQKCVVGATDCQFYLEGFNTNYNDTGGYYSLDNATYGYHPVLTMDITPFTYYKELSAGWISGSTVYVAYPYDSRIALVGMEAFEFAFVDANSNSISAGTSSYTYGYPNDSHYISQIQLPEAISGLSNVGLYWKNGANSASGVIVLSNSQGGGGSADFSANELAIRERIAAATADINAASVAVIAQVDANETKIDANNVLLHEVDFRTREIQKDTAAGGQVIPASGIAALNFNANMTQENAWDIQLYGQSKTSNEPNLSFWITHGKVPTSSKTYKVATLGDSITYVGAYDSKADAAAIGGASVYTHIYTTHFTPADATGVYHVAGVCSDGTRAWSIGGDFVFGATPSLTLNDQLTATAFNARADQWDTMLDALAAGEIYACTIYRAAAAISRTTAGVNIDEATDSVYVPLEGVYGYERSFTKTDGTTTTRRWLLDHDEGSTNGERSKVREIGSGYTIQTWAAAQGHSITWSGGSYTP